MIYWEMDDVQVSKTLETFTKKSLGTSVFDSELNNYVYTIDVWVLEYLKLKEDENIVAVSNYFLPDFSDICFYLLPEIDNLKPLLYFKKLYAFKALPRYS